MKEKKIYLDISQFISHPYKTGIQRVLYEVLNTWKTKEQLVPIFINEKSETNILPYKVIELIQSYFQQENNTIEATSIKIKSFSKIINPINLLSEDDFLIFNPELFYNQNRINYYQNFIKNRGADLLYFIIYDLLPFINPEYFPRNILTGCTPYLTLIVNLKNCGFISEKTKRDFITRAAKSDNLLSKPILPLGGDTLGTNTHPFDSTNITFTVVGDIRPRKNTEKVIDVFENIWKKGIKIKLQLCGPLNWPNLTMKNRLESLKSTQNLFSWIEAPSDQVLRDSIINSRCTIYASENEGFGLPPLESLSLGTPVIVGNHIPSIENLTDDGMIKLRDINHNNLEQAISQMTNNSFANEKQIKIKDLNIPKWSDLGKKINEWLLD
jgi:glycosyltransferase involved in cell wall biosynthesis